MESLLCREKVQYDDWFILRRGQTGWSFPMGSRTFTRCARLERNREDYTILFQKSFVAKSLGILFESRGIIGEICFRTRKMQETDGTYSIAASERRYESGC